VNSQNESTHVITFHFAADGRQPANHAAEAAELQAHAAALGLPPGTLLALVLRYTAPVLLSVLRDLVAGRGQQSTGTQPPSTRIDVLA